MPAQSIAQEEICETESKAERTTMATGFNQPSKKGLHHRRRFVERMRRSDDRGVSEL